ncbi:MAG: hypothetical protein AB7R55_05720 [Gemmatimonadales bacterium]
MPNWAHLHVMINHLPIIGLPLVTLLLVIGMGRRSRELVATAAALTVLLGAGSLLVKHSGEEAEEVVEELSWADRQVIHNHEEAGEKATLAALATALVAVVVGARAIGQAVLGLTGPALLLVMLLGSSGLMAWTALEGGEIRHDEFSLPADRPPGGDEDDR